MTLDAHGVLVACLSCRTTNRLRYEGLGRATRCARCHAALPPPSSPIDVPDVPSFDRVVATSALPLVVDFWAPWCGPCRMMAPELDTLARRRAGELLVVKVDTDALPDLGDRFRIRSIPTLGVFRGGREVTRVSGVRSADDVDALVSGSRPDAR